MNRELKRSCDGTLGRSDGGAFLIAALLLIFLIAGARAVSAKPLPFTGTNLSGGEFCNPQPGKPPVYGKNFIFPSAAEFSYFASKGMNVFRIPFRWETLQPALKQPLVPAEVAHLKDVVRDGTSKGLTILLDPHNYARYYGGVIGGPKVSDEAFADFWRRLATEFKGNPRVWFGLMNEPHDLPTPDWFAAAQAAITAIRGAGAKNLILVPGNGWDGAHSWVQAGNDLLLKLHDPDNHFIFEAHQYLDTNNSGTRPGVVSATIGSERLRAFTEWLRRNHRRAFLGEFGAGAGATAKAAVNDMLTYMENSRDVWAGFTWWSAGPWWGNYMFSIEPDKGVDKPQMAWLIPHLHGAPAAADAAVSTPADFIDADSIEPAAAPDPGAAAVQALAAEPNPFSSRIYHPTPLPTFEASRAKLPQPVIADHPEWTQLYWKAWELAFAHLKQPSPGSGFVSNFIDPAFNENTFQWDSCFMVLFAHYAEPEFHAIGSLDNFYAKEHSNGFICREINRATGEDRYYGGIENAANPPLFSWIEWENYLMTGDSGRFRSVLPVLVKNYLWLQANRTRPDGFYWNTGLGAGEDDLVRNRTAYDWMDMTAQQAQNAYYIALIARSIGDRDAAAYFEAENRKLAHLVNARMWDPTTGFYYDLQQNGRPTGIRTVLGFWPMLAHIASPIQAASLVKWLQNPNAFWREDVVPALAKDQPGYSADGQYWNGAVWAPTNSMVVLGLHDYGYDDLAARVSARYLANMADVLGRTGTIWENYAPEKPMGHGAADMVGWSGDGPIMLLIQAILGIRAPAANHTVSWRPRLPGENGIRRLTVGAAHLSLIAGPIHAGRRTFTMQTDAPLTVLLDTGVGKPAVYHLHPGSVTLVRPAAALDLNEKLYWPPAGPNSNLALNRTVTASSSDKGLPAFNVTDGDSRSRWSSAKNVPDPQWISVDLGTPSKIGDVRIVWEAAYATAFEVQVSPDGRTWTDLFRTTAGTGGTTDLNHLTGSGRYVRLLLNAKPARYSNYSIYEIGVYAKPE